MHTTPLQFRPATASDCKQIWEIIQQAKLYMLQENRRQWDETYPTQRHIADDIRRGYAYGLCNGTTVMAYGAIIFDGEAAYQNIDGAWLSHQPYVVLHRLAVATAAHGHGTASTFIAETEKLALKHNVQSFKIDTNFDNGAMRAVLKKCGFTYCGKITYEKGWRMAYEKLL